MDPSVVLRLRPGKEKRIRSGYPWVLRSELLQPKAAEPGCIAELRTAGGEFLAVGTYNSQARFPFRVLSLEPTPIDVEFIEGRLQRCLERRADLIKKQSAYRLVFAEADGLPGLIVGRYGPHLAVQVRTAGTERLRHLWQPVLCGLPGVKSLYERSEMEGRRDEGLEPYAGPISGETPEEVEVEESGIRHIVPITSGLKTGFYLDQRESRRRLGEQVRPGERVLDCFCYTGGFALSAARAGASVMGVDLNTQPLELAHRNAEANGLDVQWKLANAFEYLEHDAPSDGPFDWVVLDPPAIAKTSKGRDSLKWAVWKLVFHALPAIKPGGRLVACSCSYQVGMAELMEACTLAAADRGRPLVLEAVTFQDLDHPAPLGFPESLYLKCLWLRA